MRHDNFCCFPSSNTHLDFASDFESDFDFAFESDFDDLDDFDV